MPRNPAPLANILVDLPRPDLSAREAVELIHAHAVHSQPNWEGCVVSSEGAADKSGRLVPEIGGWLVIYSPASSANLIRATLYAGGNIVLRQSIAVDEPPPLFQLDTRWIDSTVAAEIICQEPLVEGMEDNFGFSLSLQAVPDLGLFWQLTRHCFERAANCALSHQFAVDASLGEIAAEVVQRISPRGVVQRRRRDRLNGGDWQNF